MGWFRKSRVGIIFCDVCCVNVEFEATPRRGLSVDTLPCNSAGVGSGCADPTVNKIMRDNNKQILKCKIFLPCEAEANNGSIKFLNSSESVSPNRFLYLSITSSSVFADLKSKYIIP
jgi:hypothetical protein